MESKQEVPVELGLNKPLPPTPHTNATSSSSASSKSKYSDYPKMEDDCTDVNATRSSETVHLSLPQSPSRPNQSGSSQDEPLTSAARFKPEFSSTVHDLQSNTFSRSLLPTSKTWPLESSQIGTIESDFKSLGYDQVDERPIIFHPQARLIDLAQRRKRKTNSLVNLFKRPDRKAQLTEAQNQGINEQVSPPRPPRPSRNLCPSPPYNLANMPRWRGETISQLDLAERLASAERIKSGGKTAETLKERLPQMSTIAASEAARPIHGRRYNFVNQSDIHRSFEAQYETVEKEPTLSDSETTGSLFTGSSFSPRSPPQWFRSRSHGGTSSIGTSEFVGSPTRIRGSSNPSTRSRRTTVNELEFVPEDASLRSFSGGSTYNSEDKTKSKHVVGSTLQSSIQPIAAHLQNSPHSASQSMDEISQVQLSTEDEGYRREYERVKSISHILRAQFQKEWEDDYGKKLRNAEDLIASYSTANSNARTQGARRSFNDEHRRVIRDEHKNSWERIAGTHYDSNDPESSTTLARLPELCTTPEANDNPDGVRTSMCSDVSAVSEFGVDLSSLVPPPLRSGKHPRGGSRNRSEPRWTPAKTPQKHNAQQRNLLRSGPSVPKSSTRRLFSGSNIDASSVDIPVTESGEWLYEAESRTPSPLLPISPHPPQPRVQPLPFPLDISTQMSNLNRPQSSTWDLRRVRSALRLSRRLSNELEIPPIPKRTRSTSLITTSRESSLSQYTDYPLEEEPEEEMYYHQNRGTARVPRTIPEQFREPSPPPPVPSRSSRRPIPQPQNPHAGMSKAELNGVADSDSLSLSRSTSRTSSKGSEYQRSNGGSGASTPVLRESITPQKAYGPFRQMSYRGRSVMYHVNAQGEYTF